MKSWNGFTCSSTSYSNQQLHNNPLNRDNGVILEGMDKEHCPALSIPFYSDKSNHRWQKTAFPSDNPTESAKKRPIFQSSGIYKHPARGGGNIPARMKPGRTFRKTWMWTKAFQAPFWDEVERGQAHPSPQPVVNILF